MQTTVLPGGQSVGFPGQLADDSDADIVSGFNQDSTQMPFGYGLRKGTAERFYSLATGFSSVMELSGVCLHGYDHMPAGSQGPSGTFQGDLGGTGLIQNAAFDVLRRGRVLAPVRAAVKDGDRAFCVGIATGTLTPGLWAGSGYGVSYHIDCTRQAVFRSASFTAADGTTLVAVLEVDFTNRMA